MTLILSAFSRHAAIQISDRRLSWEGSVRDDEANKGFTVNFGHIGLMVAYTGTARFENFVTGEWLTQALVDSGGETCRPVGTMKRFAERATKDYPAGVRGTHELTFLFTGYFFAKDGAKPVRVKVTNKRDNGSIGRFEFSEQTPPEAVGRTLVWAGNTRAVRQEDTDAILGLASRDVPTDAIVDKAVDLFRKIAERPGSGITIGKQLNSMVLLDDISPLPGATAEPSLRILCRYHSEKVENKVFIPDNVSLVPGKKFGTPSMWVRLHTVDEAGNDAPDAVMSVPPARPNALCGCGSGKRYRKCHGRRPKRRKGSRKR